MRQAQQLRKLFEYVGDSTGIYLEVIITDGRQPVGRGIGPALEARDVMQVLECDPNAPQDLRQKALRLAGRVLEFDPDVRGGYGFSIARDILDSGRALAKMNSIIQSQGARAERPIAGPLAVEIAAPREGVVTVIDNLQMNRIARLAGAPLDKGAGVDLLKKVGDTVVTGEPLYRIVAQFKADFGFACALAEKGNGYLIGAEDEIPGAFVDY